MWALGTKYSMCSELVGYIPSPQNPLLFINKYSLPFSVLIKIDSYGAGAMAQWSGALDALPEDLGLIPSNYLAAHNHL